MQAHIWGLDRQLDKFTTEYVQQHLQRGSHGLLTLSEVDFAFPPNVSPAMIIQARLKGHASVSSAGLSPVSFGCSKTSSKGSRLTGGIGWLREVRLLQDPNPRLHNFPEVITAYACALRSLLSCQGHGCSTVLGSSFGKPLGRSWAYSLVELSTLLCSYAGQTRATSVAPASSIVIPATCPCARAWSCMTLVVVCHAACAVPL